MTNLISAMINANTQMTAIATLVLKAVIISWYLSGDDIHLYRSTLMKDRCKIDATPQSMSMLAHVFLNHAGNTHLGPVNKYAAQTGIENTATRRSVKASDTTKWFVTLRSFRNIAKAHMTNVFPIKVRMMMIIRNTVDTSLSVKSKSSYCAVGDESVEFVFTVTEVV